MNVKFHTELRKDKFVVQISSTPPTHWSVSAQKSKQWILLKPSINFKIFNFSQRVLGVMSSIHVYLFLQHVVHNCSTWMTSCVQFEKKEG